MTLNELLDQPLKYEIEENTDRFFIAHFQTPKSSTIKFWAENEGAMFDEDEGEWMISFGAMKKDGMVDFDKTGKGDEFSVFSTIKAILDDFIKKKNPKVIEFSASKYDGENRGRLYAKMFKKNLPSGWKLDVNDGEPNVFFKMTRA